MTTEISLTEALSQMDKVIAAAQAGDEFILTEGGKPVVRVSPIQQKELAPRQFGTAKGQVWMSDDFDAPLEDFKDYM